MKFRKKPVVVDAFCLGHDPIPEWIIKHVPLSRISWTMNGEGDMYVEIVTEEGTMKAYTGDYIIRGVQGEVYPCKADIFEMTYEPVCGGEEG